MKVNERWEELKEESHANIPSEKGILNRQIRSIHTEDRFGDIKENKNFRRFNYRSIEKVYKEFMLYAIGRNISQIPRSKLTGHQISSAASCGGFDPRGSRQVYMQACTLGSLLHGNKYHRFLHDKIHKFEGKTAENAA